VIFVLPGGMMASNPWARRIRGRFIHNDRLVDALNQQAFQPLIMQVAFGL
jgi:hypothetical protein